MTGLDGMSTTLVDGILTSDGMVLESLGEPQIMQKASNNVEWNEDL